MFIEVRHNAHRFLVRRSVAFIISAALVSHNLDALLNQPVEALLECRVHRLDCRRKLFRVEVITIHNRFPLLCELILF